MPTQVRVVPLARASIDNVVRDLESTPPGNWPVHLTLASETLRQYRNLSEQEVPQIIIASIPAAHACAVKINRQIELIVANESRTKLRTAFKRIGNCANRASANLRRRLDAVLVDSIAHQEIVDLETILEFLEVSATVFV